MISEQQNDKFAVLGKVKKELEALALKNVPELDLNEIRRIIKPLEVEEFAGKGSSIHFRHRALVGISHYYNGYFQIHIVHKGGNKYLVKRMNFKKFLLPPLLLIIDILKNPKLK